MDRLVEWTGEEWIPRQEKLNGKYVGHKACMKKLAEYEAIDLTPDEVETLKYLRSRYEDEAYDYCGEYGTENCQPKTRAGWIPVSERLPELDETGYAYVLVCMDDEFVATTDFTRDGGFGLWPECGEVVAWMPLPEPYKAE